MVRIGQKELFPYIMLKSHVPESTSRLTSNRGRLVRMVDQNGGKFECLQKIIKKLRFIQIEKFFRRSSLGEMQN